MEHKLSEDAILAARQRLDAVDTAVTRGLADARRMGEHVTCIAISKTHDAEHIQPLLAAGQRHFGENRVAEAAAKWPALRAEYPDITLHMVGQLQSNKAAEAVALFDVIHSLDRPSLLHALAKAMDAQGRRIPCFIQLNLEGAAQKGGCAPAALGGLIAAARAANVPVAGLMCVAPLGLEPAPWFALTAKLADDHGLTGLSMGMSGDFPTAVRIGATHIRVGSALFGERQR
ncbi:MAG: YggS family pyridoxal phosphate-dependent enzyme [Sphingomonadaceae bacterium]|nr:YggS family pyridoxal phosphate-dependent enzyme [Sphingomonadaceae bacterium]